MAQDEYAANLPRKRLAAGALFLDDDRRILIVKPTYRTEWLVPGGVVEGHESPRTACAREIREELGLDVEPGRLLCIEYRSEAAQHSECVQFIFFGGRLPTEQIGLIRLPPSELEEFRFVDVSDAMTKLNPRLASRIELALRALREERTIYAEDGHEPQR